MLRKATVILLVILFMLPLSSCMPPSAEMEPETVLTPVPTQAAEPTAAATAHPLPTVTAAPKPSPAPEIYVPEPDQYVLYLKDIELYYSDLVHDRLRLTSFMLANVNRETPGFIEGIYDSFCKYYLHVSGSGTSIFFPDQIGQHVPVHVFRPEKGISMPIAEDTAVNRYSEDGRIYVHQREDHSLERVVIEDTCETRTVDTGLEILYTLSADGKNAIYKKPDGSLWAQTDWDPPRELSAGIDEALAYDPERRVLVYREGNTVYSADGSADPVIVTTAGFECLRLYPDGSMFFTDPDTARPVQIVDKVYATPEKLEKREPSSSTVQALYARNLYFFDGQEAHLLTDSFTGDDGSYCFAKDRPMMAFLVPTGNDSSSVMAPYRDGYRDALQRTIADGGKVYGLQGHWGRAPALAADGSCLLFMEDCMGMDPGLLYRVRIGENGPEEPEVMMEDVSIYIRPQFVGNSSTILFCRDVTKETVTLYLDGEKADEGVSIGACEYDDDTGSLVYFKDMDRNSQAGTMFLYRDGTSRKVAEQVRSVEFAAGGRILYLIPDGHGLYTLMMDMDGTQTVLDSGVSLIFRKKDVMMN